MPTYTEFLVKPFASSLMPKVEVLVSEPNEVDRLRQALETLQQEIDKNRRSQAENFSKD